MTTPEESHGLSRRDMLKRSAAVGGTLMWVTPTVSVLSATAARADGSDTPRGDGSPLDASYYILSIKCGTTYYLVKVQSPGKDETVPFTLEYGQQVKGSANDPNDGVPASESNGIARRHIYALESAGLPPDVAFFVNDGQLWLDLDANGDKAGCTLDYWIAHKGQLYFKKGGYAKAYDPTKPEPSDPFLLVFPLLPNK